MVITSFNKINNIVPEPVLFTHILRAKLLAVLALKKYSSSSCDTVQTALASCGYA